MVERTLLLVKPDGVRRGLIGEVISRLEKKGLKIIALKMIKMDKNMGEEFYSVHRDKPFYDDLVNFIISGPIVAIILEGDSAISVVRLIIGSTDGRKAQPGTIRGDFALSIQDNVVHASDSQESFEREYKIIFKENEIIDY
ncbi:MAG: nucleoside-diphosphate kinase [Caldisphaera sp.]|nr:MAG: nucleoside-diphosphate kinase [Caldisphaera sp.]